MSHADDSNEATARFGRCADAYATARPSYPAGLGDLVVELLSAAPSAPGHVVDLGAGTGLFTNLIADLGLRVTAVEPNDAMRRVLERGLDGRNNVDVVAGTAEATSLPSKSADLLTAAQAFHWFDSQAVRAEADRILRPTGSSLIVWNTRRTDVSAMQELDVLLRRFARDYEAIAHVGAYRQQAVDRYADGRQVQHHALPHAQRLTRDKFRGWLSSISYLPRAPDAASFAMFTAMDDWFGRHSSEDEVTIRYTTDAYVIVQGVTHR